MKKIAVSSSNGSTCAAVIVDGELEAIYFSSEDNPRLVGNIYKEHDKNILEKRVD